MRPGPAVRITNIGQVFVTRERAICDVSGPTRIVVRYSPQVLPPVRRRPLLARPGRGIRFARCEETSALLMELVRRLLADEATRDETLTDDDALESEEREVAHCP